MMLERIVIAGAGAAGLTAAETLRRGGFDGSITVVGDEEHLPYDRPPLSKQALYGDLTFEQTALRPPDALDALRAHWHSGDRAVSLDPMQRIVALASGTEVPYDGLVVATGVRARELSAAAGVDRIHTLRTFDDALKLRAELSDVDSVAVIGAGVLGCELAASARRMGKSVALIEPAPQPMLRQVGPWLSEWFATLHQSNGVALHTGTGVIEMKSTPSGVDVALTNGERLSTQLVVVAVGSVPNTEWLLDAGLDVQDGLLCDETLLAGPDVVAAGDVANWWHPGYGQRMRVEHRTNAAEQGRAAAKRLMGVIQPFQPVPYFWSDQYGGRLQGYGLPSATAEVEVVDGDAGSDRFALRYVEHGRVRAGVAWNMPRAALALRKELVHELAQQPA